MENLAFLFGRFHPLLVHLPIGILFMAFTFEVLSRFKNYKKLGITVSPMILWGAFAATLSAISGLALSQEGGYEDRLLNLHRNFGIATAAFSFLLYFMRRKALLHIKGKNKLKQVRIVLFMPLIILLTATGHFGGSLTHGEDYLTGISFSAFEEPPDPAIKIQLISNVPEASLYPDVIQPIFESRCYSCHSSKKQKGDLRLDTQELILHGGKNGEIILPGNADSSALYARLVLPLEDEHHMPPSEKTQLTSAEIDLVKLWIADGASMDRQVKSFSEANKIIEAVNLIAESAEQEDWLPLEKVTPAKEQIVRELKESGVLVLPMGANTNYLEVSFINKDSIDKKDVEQLLSIKDQMLSLSFSTKEVHDSDLIAISKFDKLIWLHLDHTMITDSLSTQVAKLNDLRYLNLVGTGITDDGLSSLVSLKNLKQIYLFETSTTSKGIKNFSSKLPSVKIDTGYYVLPDLATDTIIYKRKT